VESPEAMTTLGYPEVYCFRPSAPQCCRQPRHV